MRKPSNRPIASAIFIIGLSGITAQIVFMRELLVVFYGNEVSIGFILGVWLLAGGIGSWALGRLSDRIANKLAIFIAAQMLLSVFTVVSLYFIRSIKPFFNILAGELTSLPIMAIASAIALFPVCILLGFLFTLSCRVLTLPTGPVRQVGYVYAVEGAGAAVGGLVCNLLLIKVLTSFQIICLLVALNFCISLWLLRYVKFSFGYRLVLQGSLAVIVSALIFLNLDGKLDRVDRWTKEREWRHFTLAEDINTIYGNITVTKQNGLTSFFNNGILMFTAPDLLMREENTHFAMLQRPDAKKVLLIGGGSSGTLEEVLKYPVERVDYVELDPAIIELSKKHLKYSQSSFLEDARVDVITSDGRFYLQRSQEYYNVIILNMPDPFTAQLNRFYTLEFFNTVKKRMDGTGVFCFGLTSSENYVSEELALFLSSIRSTLREVFDEVKIIPGDTAYFLASPEAGTLELDAAVLTRRLKELHIDTKFVRDYYLFSKLSEGRLAYINERLTDRLTCINRDFSPVSYYYDTILWTTYFKNTLRSFFKKIHRKTIYASAAGLYMAILLCGILGRGFARRRRSVLVAVATTGFSEISFEVIGLIAFQVLYGYLYYKLGIIVTSFMVGLSAGGFLMAKRMNAIRDPYKTFIKIQAAICLYPLLLPLIFFILRTIEHWTLRSLASNAVFTLLPAVAGVMGGLQFPLANKIYLKRVENLGSTAGINYGVDMIGSCAGALLVSALVIPIVGINGACLLVALLNCSSLAILIHNRRNVLY